MPDRRGRPRTDPAGPAGSSDPAWSCAVPALAVRSVRAVLLAACVSLAGSMLPVYGDELDLAEENRLADRVHGNGKSALMLAARDGDRQRVRELLGAGARVNRANHNGGTPIMYAALGGDYAIVDLFLRRGADVNAAAHNGWSALMIAAAKGYARIARRLLEHGADPNRTDIYAWTPLMRAVHEGRVNTARVLLDDRRTRVNARGENGVTALHLAVLRGEPRLVEALRAAGADPALTDDEGRTPRSLALERHGPGLASLLGPP